MKRVQAVSAVAAARWCGRPARASALGAQLVKWYWSDFDVQVDTV